MHGLKHSPFKLGKHKTAEPKNSDSSRPNPFDSDDDSKPKQNNSLSKAQSDPVKPNSTFTPNPFDDDLVKGAPPPSNSQSWSTRNKYKNDFRDEGGLETQSVQELENYSVYKAEETTNSVNGCLKIAEEIREDATKTLVTLHQQGEQITRTHMVAADIDHDLSRGEKLLGNLGGMFSKTWKPKKTRQITGPVITRDDLVSRKGNHLEQREKLGLSHGNKPRSSSQTSYPEPTDAYQKVEVEKTKQDDALSDLSSILGELKEMAIDMSSEIDLQNKALDNFYDDTDEIGSRVRDANRRGQRLLRK